MIIVVHWDAESEHTWTQPYKLSTPALENCLELRGRQGYVHS